MGLQNWRWYHWLIVSIVVGGALGLVFTTMSTDDPSIPSVSFSQMRGKVQGRTEPGNKGDSLATMIRVGPVILDANNNKVQSVTFFERQHNRVTNTWDPVRQFRTVTPVPLSATSPRPDFGVLDYLADQKKTIPSLDWKYQWWLVPRYTWLMCLGGSVLVIGLLWPAAIWAMVRLGLAEPPDERGPSLADVKIHEDDAELSTGAVVTDDDRQKLADLNAELAANVAGMTVASGPKDAAHVDEPVRMLKGDAVTEVVAATPDKSAEDYKGEYYPVARPIVKK